MDTKIPVPPQDFIEEITNEYKKSKDLSVNGKKLGYKNDTKHAHAYEDFCKWYAVPPKERNPKSQLEFEKRHRLPYNYTTVYFKNRTDFGEKVFQYLFEWMMEKFPEVVYSVYRRATRNSPKDANLFIDLMSKKMNVNKPAVQPVPFVVMGVPQEKIDALFTPPKKIEEVDGNS